MAEIVIIGHGGYAEGVRSNLEMVIGVPESMHFLNFALGMERSELEAALSTLVEGLEGREILFCVDLPGATPSSWQPSTPPRIRGAAAPWWA